jgi:putative addiction module CopG family antidote
MSFALPESMREYIDNRVAAGNYGNTSEYIRDLVRRDQERPRSAFAISSKRTRIRTRAAPHEGGREGTAGHRSRRDRLKLAVLRPQALRDQQGEVRYYRKEGGSRVAVKVVKATNAVLDQIELDPGIARRSSESAWAFQGFRPGGLQSSRCSGATLNAETTWMWSDCWASARTLRRSWATSSPRTEGARIASTQAWAPKTGFRASDRRDGRPDPTRPYASWIALPQSRRSSRQLGRRCRALRPRGVPFTGERLLPAGRERSGNVQVARRDPTFVAQGSTARA